MRNDSLSGSRLLHRKFIVVNLIFLIFGLSRCKKCARESPLNEFENSMKLDDGILNWITNYLDYLVFILKIERTIVQRQIDCMETWCVFFPSEILCVHRIGRIVNFLPLRTIYVCLIEENHLSPTALQEATCHCIPTLTLSATLFQSMKNNFEQFCFQLVCNVSHQNEHQWNRSICNANIPI